MSIIEHIRPLSKPETIAAKEWLDIEKRLEITYPTVYKEFVSNLGLGLLNDFFVFYVPSAHQYLNIEGMLEFVKIEHKSLKENYEKISPGEILDLPFQTLDKGNGLIPFACTENDDRFHWFFENGKAKSIIVEDAEFSTDPWPAYPPEFSTFLSDLLFGRLKLEVLPDDLKTIPPFDFKVFDK